MPGGERVKPRGAGTTGVSVIPSSSAWTSVQQYLHQSANAVDGIVHRLRYKCYVTQSYSGAFHFVSAVLDSQREASFSVPLLHACITSWHMHDLYDGLIYVKES